MSVTQHHIRREDKALVREAADPDSIHSAAKGIAQEGSTSPFSANLRQLASVRKSHITYIDLLRPYRMALAIAGLGTVLIASLLVWTALHPLTIEGATLYAMLAALIGATALTVTGVRRMRAVTQLDELLPPSIDEADVVEAGRVVSTFGAHRYAAGSAITGMSSIIEGAVAGWVIAAVLAAAMPLWLQAGAAVLTALTMVWVAGVLNEKFRARIAVIRARQMARHAMELREVHYAGATAEAEWIVAWTKPITGNDLDRPTWRQFAIAGTFILGIVMLFAALGVIRLISAPADGSALSDGVVVATVLLATLFAVLGALVNAMGPLRPDEQRKATVLHDRFPNVVTFRHTKARLERAIELWCNGIARRVHAAYRDIWVNMDPRKRGTLVEVSEPFPFAEPPSTPSVDKAPGPQSQTAAGSPVVMQANGLTKSASSSHDFGGLHSDVYSLFKAKPNDSASVSGGAK